MKNDKPEVWMIVMTGNPISDYYRNLAVPSWLDAGYKVNYYEGVTPDNYHEHTDLTFTTKHSRRDYVGVMFTVSEKCVWHSHYYLWKKCYEENLPMIVCEHDIEIVKEIPSRLFDLPIACLAHNPPDIHRDNTTSLAGGAYFLSPQVAKLMLSANESDINRNSDGWIWEHCRKYGEKHYDKCRHIKDYDVGFTVKHNKSKGSKT